MAFCEKCGKELGPDGVCDCQKTSAEPAVSAVPAASSAPADPASDKNKLIGIIAVVAALVVVLLVLIFLLLRNMDNEDSEDNDGSVSNKDSYEAPFEDLQKLINEKSTDLFAYQKVISDPMTAQFNKEFYDIVKSNEEVKENYKEAQEQLKYFYDYFKGFKITEIEIKKADKMKSSELRDIKDQYDKGNFEYALEVLSDMDSDDYEDMADSLDISKSAAKKLVKAMKSYYESLGKANVQEGYDVQVIVRAKYDGKEDKTDRIAVQVLKINNKWYIHNAGLFLRSTIFYDDLADISLYDIYRRINLSFGGSLMYGF